MRVSRPRATAGFIISAQIYPVPGILLTTCVAQWTAPYMAVIEENGTYWILPRKCGFRAIARAHSL